MKQLIQHRLEELIIMSIVYDLTHVEQVFEHRVHEFGLLGAENGDHDSEESE